MSAPKEPVPKESPPKEPMSKESTSKESVPKESIPKDSIPKDSAPKESAPIESTNTKNSTAKKGVLVFEVEALNSKITDKIKKSYKKYAKSCNTLPELAQSIKKCLDTKFSNGWVVFVGRQMVGACAYIEGTLVTFEVDGLAFVIFQTYCPIE